MCQYKISACFFILLCTFPAHANKSDELLERVISVINQNCLKIQANANNDVLDNVISVDREYVAASMEMRVFCECDCLPSELKRIRSDYSGQMELDELDALTQESIKMCAIRSNRKYFSSLCKASMLSETDDQIKIDSACKCMAKKWNKLSDKEIYESSIAAYKQFKQRVEGSSIAGDALVKSHIDLEGKDCMKNAGIVADSQYKKERAAIRKNELARRHANSNLRMIAAVLNLYKLDHGYYPPSTQGLSILLKESVSPFTRRKVGPYLRNLPKDAWDNRFMYSLSEDGNNFKVLSFGQDGKPGGTGFDQDVVLSSDEL
jgi:general secretion pathway protein G